MLVELRSVTKRFGSVVANDGVDLRIGPGEIVGLLGENGAGKSTLMHTLHGLHRPDEGTIVIDGRPVTFAGPSDAIAAGIGMVHQHFMLVPPLTVAENVALGAEQVHLGTVLARRRIAADVVSLAQRHGLAVDPGTRIEQLPVGVQQRVELLKLLARDAELLILDEPTAVLTPQETRELSVALEGLRDQGRSIVFISHKLAEVRRLCDRIVVMRKGRVVGETSPGTSESELATMMVGRDVRLTVDRGPCRPGDATLDVRDLVVERDGGRAVDGVSFSVRAGEIVAIAGVEGNGQTELVDAITGMAPATAGSVQLVGRSLLGQSRRSVLAAGVAHVPADRGRHGVISSFSVADNLVSDRQSQPPFARRCVRRRHAVAAEAERLFAEFDIRAASPDVPAGELSGGNQQKVVLARALARPKPLIVAAQPTRGVDVGAIEYVHAELVARRDAGAAVLLVSSELDEVLALGDRIGVMYRGRMAGPFDAGDLTREAVGLLMAGADAA